MKYKCRNAAQIGDAVIKEIVYPEYNYMVSRITFKRTTEIHIKENPNFHCDWHHGKGFYLELWSGVRGIVNIPLLSKGNLYQSIFAMNFSKEELELFSHVIMKNIFDNIEIRPEVFERIESYRLDDLNKSLILAKTEY